MLYIRSQQPSRRERRQYCPFGDYSERYTVKFPFKRMIFLRTDRDNAHPRAHWVTILKKYRLHHASHLCQLIEDDLEMAEK